MRTLITTAGAATVAAAILTLIGPAGGAPASRRRTLIGTLVAAAVAAAILTLAGTADAAPAPRWNACQSIDGFIGCHWTTTPPEQQRDTFAPADAGITVHPDGSGTGPRGSFPAGTFTPTEG